MPQMIWVWGLAAQSGPADAIFAAGSARGMPNAPETGLAAATSCRNPSSRRRPRYVPRLPTPGSSSRLRVQDLHRFRGLHPDYGARHSLAPPSRAGMVATPQASRHATDRIVAPFTGLLTLGSDPARCQTEAASLLPGLLAATRTGLSPAGGDAGGGGKH